MFSDGLSVENSRNPHYQHAQLRSNDGQHGAECFEKENRQQGELCPTCFETKYCLQ